jgi:hypothetical protein
MAEDFDDLFDVENLDDDELRELVVQQFREYPSIDADLLDVDVHGGAVRVSGRVGTDAELQHVEHVLANVLGVPGYANEVVVDALVRAEQPEAGDDAAGEGPAEQELADRTDPEAQHLLEDTEGDLYGTEDMHKSISRGQSYHPPDGPGREGFWSGEDH